MNLEYLTEGLKCEIIGDNKIEIASLACDHKDCEANALFFCINGNSLNGADFAPLAIKKGAVAVVSDQKLDLSCSQIIVKDVRKAMSKITQRFYDYPQKKLKTIGVVGTNGKSSVCEMIAKGLNDAKIGTGIIGTGKVKYKNTEINTDCTTPDTPFLYKCLADMVNDGIKAVCMELSAHAIYYGKADFTFDILVFTNCARDHLDFFGSEEKYREVKASAFTSRGARLAVVNSDDPLGKVIALSRKSGTINYGLLNPSDVFAIDVRESFDGTTYLLNLFDCLYEIKSNLMGVFNVYNSLAAATVLALCGLKTDFIANELMTIKPIKGRMQRISTNGKVFLDYAHTPEALENALKTLKVVKGKNKLFCVFGCGGNRDAGKRAIMGRISGKLADFTVITSDNPRFEDENEIISQIESGIREVTNEYITIRDRKEAIDYCISLASAEDYVLIAGKGAENYQEVMGTKRTFSDEETACALLVEKYDKR